MKKIILVFFYFTVINCFSQVPDDSLHQTIEQLKQEMKLWNMAYSDHFDKHYNAGLIWRNAIIVFETGFIIGSGLQLLGVYNDKIIPDVRLVLIYGGSLIQLTTCLFGYFEQKRAFKTLFYLQ